MYTEHIETTTASTIACMKLKGSPTPLMFRMNGSSALHVSRVNVEIVPIHSGVRSK